MWWGAESFDQYCGVKSMKPTETNPEFMICPKCGADTHRDDGKWVCRNCGYEVEAE